MKEREKEGVLGWRVTEGHKEGEEKRQAGRKELRALRSEAERGSEKEKSERDGDRDRDRDRDRGERQGRRGAPDLHRTIRRYIWWPVAAGNKS